MATVWLTYAWKDNEDQTVDFIAQELRAAGVAVKLDRWNIGAGGRLWEQIERFITSPEQSDAWILVATQNSLASEPCKEEFAIALQRALETRGGKFPVIGLFPGEVEQALIPASIKARLYVAMTDPEWKERIKAAAEGRDGEINRPNVDPFYLRVHHVQPGTVGGAEQPIAIELRPRAGYWGPTVVAVPVSEKDKFKHVMFGPPNYPVWNGMTFTAPAGPSDDGTMWFQRFDDQATPIKSIYFWVSSIPKTVLFGALKGPTWSVDLAA